MLAALSISASGMIITNADTQIFATTSSASTAVKQYTSNVTLRYSNLGGVKNAVTIKQNGKTAKTIETISNKNNIVYARIKHGTAVMSVRKAATGESQSAIYGNTKFKVKYTDGSIETVNITVQREFDKRAVAIYLIKSGSPDKANHIVQRAHKYIKSVKTVKNESIVTIKKGFKTNAAKDANKYGKVIITPNKPGIEDVIVEYTDNTLDIVRICSDKETTISMSAGENKKISISKSVKSIDLSGSDVFTKSYNANKKEYTIKSAKNKSGTATFIINYNDGNKDVYHLKSTYTIKSNEQIYAGGNEKSYTTSKDIQSVKSSNTAIVKVTRTENRKYCIKGIAKGNTTVTINLTDGSQIIINVSVNDLMMTSFTAKVGQYKTINTNGKIIKNIYVDDDVMSYTYTSTSIRIYPKKAERVVMYIDYTNGDSEYITFAISMPDIAKNKILWVGDSRTVGLINTCGGESIAKVGVGTEWAMNNKEKILNYKGYNIVFWLGCNGLNYGYYLDFLNNLPADFIKYNKIYVMAVTPGNTPLSQANGMYINNNDIKSFNDTIKNNLRSDITFIDMYKKMMHNSNYWATPDGVHYNSVTYNNIRIWFNEMTGLSY